jgi:SPP1 family predicted phage head-tail adaptor
MRAGQLRHRVTLQSMNSAGEWENARSMWAEVLTEAGTNPLRYRIRTRWRSEITADQRVVYRGSVLAMQGPPSDPEGRRRELVMICTATGESAVDGTITARGGIVTFAGAGALVYDPQTGLWTGTEVAEYSAHAVQGKLEPDELAAANLVLANTETLEVAALYNDALVPRPVPNMTFTWTGLPYTIARVELDAPDGTPLKYIVTGVR